MTSSASIFERQGNPWMTEKDRRKDYPPRRVLKGRLALPHVEHAQRRIDAIKEELGLRHTPLPEMLYQEVIEDPDFDRYSAGRTHQPRYVASQARLAKETRSSRSNDILRNRAITAILKARRAVP